jgi:hypothetical protein
MSSPSIERTLSGSNLESWRTAASLLLSINLPHPTTAKRLNPILTLGSSIADP